jgi:orotate phosphoribosyltransferase
VAASHEALARILVERSYLESDDEIFVLNSGQRSRFYFDCKRTTFHAPAIPLIGELFLERIRRAGRGARAVGGLTAGSDPIAFAVASASLRDGPPLDAFSARKTPKDHGTRNWIENCPAPGTRVVVVDDVATSGKSVTDAIERCAKEQLEVVHAIVLVDRESGGLDNIRRELPTGTPVEAIFTKTWLEELRRRGQANG